MKFFLDTANLMEIQKAAESGLVDGITTNPSLLAREGEDFQSLIKKICLIIEGPVNAEVVSETTPEMIREAKELALIHKNICVKIPMTPEGLKAVKYLSAQGIPINVTLIFSPIQALMAAKAGAAYVSPFIGRLDDIAQDGLELIEQIVTIFNNYDLDTKIIVASIRHPVHVLRAAVLGAHIATMPFKIFMQLCKHPLTDTGLEKFLSDWKKREKKK